MSLKVNPGDFGALAQLFDAIKHLPDLEADDLYLDGALTVRHAADYVVGRFYMEDGFWMFEWSEDL